MHSFSFPVDLLGLLKWNSMVGKLKHVLVDVIKVSGEEIVKVWAQWKVGKFSLNFPSSLFVIRVNLLHS